MRQQEREYYQERMGSYIDGNTVRKVREDARRHSEQIHEEYVRQQKEEQEYILRKRNARAAAKRNQAQALQMSPGYVMFLAASMMLLMGVFGCYVQLQSELNGYMKSVTGLESDLLNLKNDNDAIQKKINVSVDLEVIRKKAMQDLGMVYPEEKQIQYFEVDANDYMNQYEDIPER